MNVKEAENYAAISSEVERKIEQSSGDIVTARAELAQARGVRKNREEYDALASSILKTPSRQATTAAMAAVEAELAGLTDEATSLESQLQARQKQFALLLHSVRDIHRELESEQEGTTFGVNSPEPAAEGDSGSGAMAVSPGADATMASSPSSMDTT